MALASDLAKVPQLSFSGVSFMRTALAIVSTVALSLICGPALAQDAGLVVKPSALSVKDTLDKLTKVLDEKGIKVAARVDHAAGAKAAGMDLPPTEVVFFGNPKLGTPLMQSNPHIGIDLPMRVIAWTDKDGKTWVGYTSADALKARYGIKDKDEAFKAMAGALDAFTGAATK
jgi:uncharacterized protein (DUF302 family)